MSDVVFMAQVMREDPNTPVYAERIGTAPEVAKEAVLDAMTNEHSWIVQRVRGNDHWTEDHLAYEGWIFNIKEYDLHD